MSDNKVVNNLSEYLKTMRYLPALEAIRDGTCKQHMFQYNKIKVGDTILWHGLRNAYGSPNEFEWSRRVKVRKAIPIEIDFKRGIRTLSYNRDDIGNGWMGWHEGTVYEIAAMEGIVPPKGDTLCNVMQTRYGEVHVGDEIRLASYQIIRW